MEAPRLNPGSFWMLLKTRFFNKDSESLLLERLGDHGVEWVMNVNEARPAWLERATGVLDQWLETDLVLPGGGVFLASEYTSERKRRVARTYQFARMRNSFGMGLALGAGIYRELMARREPTLMEAFFVDVGLKDALELLEQVSVRDSLLSASSNYNFALRAEELVSSFWRSSPLSYYLAPIAKDHGFFNYGYPVMSRDMLFSAQRCMLLAGLIASGLQVPDRREWEASAGGLQETADVGVRESSSELCLEIDLHKLSDEELESLMDQVHLRESIREELTYRLRTDRLSRMLAHLERASKDEHEDTGAAGDE